MKSAKVLAGGAGFMGSHSVREIVGKGFSVVVLDTYADEKCFVGCGDKFHEWFR